MIFTKDLMAKVAKLSRIYLTDEELDKFTSQMQSILDSVKTLSTADASIDRTIISKYSTVPFASLRDDVAKESLDIKQVQANATYTLGRFIKVYGTTFDSE